MKRSRGESWHKRWMNPGKYVSFAVGTFALIGIFIAADGGVSSAKAKTTVEVAAPNSVLQQDVNRLRDIGTTGVLAVTTNGTQVTQARAGVAELGTAKPVDWASHARIGSNTKTFVATVLLQLEAEGRLSLNDTVERWLPGVVQGNGHRGDRITIKNLLQHTSGVFDYTEDEEFVSTILTAEAFLQNRYNTYTPQQLVAIAMSHAPNFAPNAKWEYSNTNYIIAGMIIEAVTGKAWSIEIQDRIIVPLGLTETSEPGTNPQLPVPFARGYQLFGTDGTYTDATLHNMTWGGAAGSLISTPENVNRFFKALMKGQLLSPTQLTKMLTTVPMGHDYDEFWPGAAYGLGIMRINLPCGGVYWSHGGDVLGYNNTNGVTPDGQRSAVIANMTNTFADPVFADNSIRYSDALVQHALCGETESSNAMSVLAANGNTPGRLRLKL